MPIDDQLVNQIVAGVMQHLGETDPLTSSDSMPSADQRETSAADIGIGITENVITAELLETRLNGSSQMVIGPRAILTPAARDYLKEHGIRWSRGQVPNEQSAASVCRWAAVVVQSTAAVISAVQQVDQESGNCCKQELVGSDADAASEAVSLLCRGDADGVVVFANSAAAIACRANRNLRIRAAVTNDVFTTKAVLRDMGANLFCVQPEGRSFIELRNLLRAVVSAGTPQPPADWNE